MKPEVISNRTKITRHRTKKLQVGDFVVTEHYVNEKLNSQTWESPLTYVGEYERKNMWFHYYEDTSFLDSEENSNTRGFYDLIPEPTLVTDWDNFDINKVLCIYLVMNGHIYQINKEVPVRLWRRQDYVGGFDNGRYDLDKVVKTLKKKSWIRNIEIIDIPYYNRYDGCNKAVEFDYRLPTTTLKQLNGKLSMMNLDEAFGTERAITW
jgi:hypothetical protein